MARVGPSGLADLVEMGLHSLEGHSCRQASHPHLQRVVNLPGWILALAFALALAILAGAVCLADVQLSASILFAIECQSLVIPSLVCHGDEANAPGTPGFLVHQQMAVCNLAALGEVRFQLLFIHRPSNAAYKESEGVGAIILSGGLRLLLGLCRLLFFDFLSGLLLRFLFRGLLLFFCLLYDFLGLLDLLLGLLDLSLGFFGGRCLGCRLGGLSLSLLLCKLLLSWFCRLFLYLYLFGLLLLWLRLLDLFFGCCGFCRGLLGCLL
mmetsp:Transcript_1253/g.2190  ORF Transcript_1253/g.2190 Transcript_1253/m.2190 type:complete len:266 (-) Transcript_1253:105-902(-)